MKCDRNNFNEVELGEACSRLSSGKSISSKEISDFGKYPVYGGNGVRGFADKKNFSGQCAIIGRQGAFCGNVRYFSGEAYMTEHAIVVCANDKNNTRYLSYLLSQLRLGRLSGQSAQPGLSVRVLEKQKINLPDLETQKKIAKILSSLDDKIELNNAINNNLQQQAQALYQNTFPYNIDDELPNGWHIVPVGDVIDLHDSKRVPLSGGERDRMRKKIYPYYGAASLMDYVDDYIFDGVYLLLGEDGTVIDANGYPVLQYVWGKFWVNNHAHIITGKLGHSVESLWVLFKHTSVRSIVTGAVQPKISQANLRSIKIVLPPNEQLQAYNEHIQPMFSIIRNNVDENQRLIELRDTLLPKLMSGELDVSEVDV